MSGILGICSPNHNSGSALIRDGDILGAIDEAKLSRTKRDERFPQAGINYLIDTFDADVSIQKIAVAGVDRPFRRRQLAKRLAEVDSATAKLDAIVKFCYDSVTPQEDPETVQHVRERIASGEVSVSPDVDVVYKDHHLCHAASAYYTSGFSEATVLTVDGAGDGLSSTVYRGEDQQLTRIATNNNTDSIGRIWSRVPTVFGFKGGRHAGKFMGLAAYSAEPSEKLRSEIEALFGTDGLDIRNEFFREYDHLSYEGQVTELKERLGRFDAPAVAAALQEQTEEVLTEFAKAAIEATGLTDVAVAGGVFANVKLNQRIYELPDVEKFFVHPEMRDSGLALGAALAVHSQNGGCEPKLIEDVYFGPEYGDETVQKALARRDVHEEFAVSEYDSREQLAENAAKRLADGEVVNLFTGRIEYGPRALGNRSTLYQPTDPSAIRWLNDRLDRTEFMPFAPVTLADHAEDCYIGYDSETCPAAAFMTISLDCTETMASRSPGVVHVDGTARPQVIDRETNPFYYDILDAYYERTGIPSLINTSFNMHGEPIVCTPSQAIKSFRESGTDALVVNRWLIEQS